MTYLRAGAFAAALELPAGTGDAADDDVLGVGVASVVAEEVALGALAVAIADAVDGAGTPVSVRGANCCVPHATSVNATVAIAAIAATAAPLLTDGLAASPACPEAAC